MARKPKSSKAAAAKATKATATTDDRAVDAAEAGADTAPAPKTPKHDTAKESQSADASEVPVADTSSDAGADAEDQAIAASAPVQNNPPESDPDEGAAGAAVQSPAPNSPALSNEERVLQRLGVSYRVMALCTGFAAFSFFLLGTKIWQLGKEHGHITPGELIYHHTGSNALRWLYALVMILFTFPYLSLQIVGAGYILETITQQQIPYLWGASFLTLFTIAYVWIGGMRSVAKTDLKQGLLAIGLMLAAVLVITNSLGGLTDANEQVFALEPGLFSREGAGDKYPPQKWFSILIFWLFCIPMFPQIFMRFYVAKDLDKLKKSALLYGGIPLIISLFPVIIGVLGH